MEAKKFFDLPLPSWRPRISSGIMYPECKDVRIGRAKDRFQSGSEGLRAKLKTGRSEFGPAHGEGN